MIRIQSTAFAEAARLPWTTRRVTFILFYGILGYTIIRLLNDVITNNRFWLRPVETNLAEIIGCLTVSFVFEWMVNSFLLQLKRDEQTGFSGSVALKQFLSLALYLEIIVISCMFPLAEFTDDGLQWYDVIVLCFVPASMWLFYFSVQRSQFLLRRSYEQALLLEKINKDKLETELQFLKAQFHPHFMFNALNTIYFQVDDSNQDARRTIETLSDLLRYQLYDQDTLVPLDQEINHLRNYISLQQTRSSDRLKLSMQWPDSPGNVKIYPLLLLPLVENAFKYVGGDPIIELKTSLENHCLCCKVTNSIPELAHQHKKGGIGLANLRKRLQLLYPDKHELILKKTEGFYTATLIIDLR